MNILCLFKHKWSDGQKNDLQWLANKYPGIPVRKRTCLRCNLERYSITLFEKMFKTTYKEYFEKGNR